MLSHGGRARTLIANVLPQIEGGRYPIKRIIGDRVDITADIITDGHSTIAASLLYRRSHQTAWNSTHMAGLENDLWKGHFNVHSLGFYDYIVTAWIDEFKTWQLDLEKKFKAGINISVEILMGIELIKTALQHQAEEELSLRLKAIENVKNDNEAFLLAMDPILYALMRDRYPSKQHVVKFDKILQVIVDPRRALFSAWYEMFPRSASSRPGQPGTFKDCESCLSYVAGLGFDVLYFPPIHPIGRSNRKGPNNRLFASNNDPGSPWAIGSQDGGHYSIHSELGTFEDFKNLVAKAKEMNIEPALDLAFQCSPDHPFIKEHPEWFSWRPDNSIQYAENPPKKYEDIIPFNFETENWKELWEELKKIVFFWIDHGITIFRVDNPHTKPFSFWEWLISEVRQKYQGIIFLAEAFTRQKIMYHLAKVGFSQSYTYFSWRHSKKELTDYVTEMTTGEIKEYFRPNLWPNTPDILTEELQFGGKAEFIIRLILAATLSSNYGVYGPPFELMVHEAVKGTEEYLNAEKYEGHFWDRTAPGSLNSLISLLNQIRQQNPALQQTGNIKFLSTNNDQIIYYSKIIAYPFNALLIAVNLDPFNCQASDLVLPLDALGLTAKSLFNVHELLLDKKSSWQGASQTLKLDPEVMPAAIFKISRN
ncbi:MAG: alpha-1,4-glucan--maltose-1-phosphate maltosyltransferase [Candidatus Protochlamydia sp.]|nr:alpha-1,4-glucan--maltose-1-phosphate maltosyltransferase [Candidatus Protochlamydia sp.]